MRKVVRPYEILVRFHADGSIAAHIGEIIDVYDDDEMLLASRELPVRPLAMAGPSFDAAMKHVDQGLLRGNADLAAEVERLQSEAATLVNAVENEGKRAERAEMALATAMHPPHGLSSFVPQVTPGGGG
jgi:hypothetical protein